MDVDKELKDAGLVPGTWKDSLEMIKGRLAPTDWDRFSRLHKNFVGYNSQDTATRFYNFVFSHGLHLEINRHRFARLAGILTVLAEEISPQLSILDVGAGSGLIGEIVKRRLSPAYYMAQDPCAEVCAFLEKQGFNVLANPPPADPTQKFDLIICVDSLGEINADEDGNLSENSGANPLEFALMTEERYGIAQKLEPWKPYLASQGRILFWEPFKHNRVWEALVTLLSGEGWAASRRADASGRPFLEIKLA